MSRPFKKRKICCEPLCMTFRPEGTSDEMGCVVLLLDEYETIRLIAFEGLSQDQCARQMQVARSTVQNIYDGARKKIAMTIVLGLPLHIEGEMLRCVMETARDSGAADVESGRVAGT